MTSRGLSGFGCSLSVEVLAFANLLVMRHCRIAHDSPGTWNLTQILTHWKSDKATTISVGIPTTRARDLVGHEEG